MRGSQGAARHLTARMTVRRLGGLLLTLGLGLLLAGCGSGGTEEQTGLAETETGAAEGGAVAGATGDGQAEGATGGADGDAVANGSGSNAATAVPVADDGGSDAKQVAAQTIDDLNEIEPAANADSADTAAVVFGEPNDGEIDGPFGLDRWTFEGAPDVMIAIDVTSIDHECRQDLTMVLEAPSGARGEVGWIGNGGCRAYGPFTLEESGTYVIEFLGGDGAIIDETAGAYRFVPYVLTERDVAPVVFDQPIDGEISELLGVDRWTFEATAQQLLVIDVLDIDNDCRQDLTLTIEDPFVEREEIAWVGNGGCRAYGPIEIERDGVYAIEFHGGDGGVIDEPTGTYRFMASLLTERDESAAAPDTKLDGEITQVFGADRWTFDATEGQRITIDVLAIDHDCRQDLTMTLEDPFAEREEIAWVGNGGCRAYDPIELTRSGTHAIEFSGGDGGVIDDNLGAYSFTFSLS